MKAAEIGISNRLTDHVSVNVFEDAARQCTRLMVKTVKVKPMSFWVQDIWTDKPCAWTHSWWARLIRWASCRRWLHRLVPYPLLALANARESILNPRTIDWPESVVDSIQAQRAVLLMDGKEPEMILVGYAARREMMMLQDFSMWRDRSIASGMDGGFMGLQVRMTPWLEENAVLVV